MFFQFFQQFFGWNKKRIVLDDSTDKHHRMCPQGINHHFSAELIEIVGANRNIASFWYGKIRTALELESAIPCIWVVQQPCHVRDEACDGKPLTASRSRSCDSAEPFICCTATSTTRCSIKSGLSVRRHVSPREG